MSSSAFMSGFKTGKAIKSFLLCDIAQNVMDLIVIMSSGYPKPIHALNLRLGGRASIFCKMRMLNCGMLRLPVFPVNPPDHTLISGKLCQKKSMILPLPIPLPIC